MFRLFKITLVILLVILLAGFFWLINNRERLLSDLKSSFEKELSVSLQKSVSINSIKFVYPFRSLILNDINISEPDSQIASIDSLIITPRILKILKSRGFTSRLEIKNYKSESLRLDASILIECSKAPSWKELFNFNSSLVNLKILKGSTTWETKRFTGIQGALSINKMSITQGAFSLEYNDIPFYVEFNRAEAEINDYHGKIKSDDIAAEGTLSFTNNTLVLDSAAGFLFPLEFSLKGRIENIDSDNKTFNLSGTIRGNVGNLPLLSPENAQMSKIKNVTGPFTASVETLFQEKDLYAGSFKGVLSSPSLQVGEVETKNMECHISFENKVLNIPSLSFNIYGSDISGNLDIDFNDENLPLSFNLKTSDIDIDLPLKSENDNYGPMDLALSFKGYGKDLVSLASARSPESEKENLFKIIKQGFLTLLEEKKLENMELAADIKLKRFELDDNYQFYDIASGMSLSKGILNISNITLKTFQGGFSFKGELDLIDENLPLSSVITITEMDSSSLLKNMISPEVTALGPLSADLSFRGDLKPFIEYSSENIKDEKAGPKNIIEKMELLKNIELSSDLRIKTLKFKNNDLSNTRVVLNIDSGSLRVPNFIFNSRNGTFSGHAEMSISDPLYPFEADFKLENVEPGDAKNLQGAISSDIYLKGSGMDVIDMFHYLNLETKTQKLSPAGKIQSGIFYLSDNKDIKKHYIRASFSSKKLLIGKAELYNITGELILNNGRLSIPYITGLYCGGLFSIDLAAFLEEGKYPFIMNGTFKHADFERLIHSLGDKKSPVTGKLDSNFKLQGNARSQDTYTGNLEIVIYNANLGKMPIITPLLGDIYSAAQNVIPAFEIIKISSAIGSFNIRDRKFITKDLVLSGGDLFIFGDGYMDFDGNLNFTFENRILPSEIEEEEEWSVSIRNFITNVGKVIGKAHLRGTLKNPKWEMEIFSHMKTQIMDNVKTFFNKLSE